MKISSINLAFSKNLKINPQIKIKQSSLNFLIDNSLIIRNLSILVTLCNNNSHNKTLIIIVKCYRLILKCNMIFQKQLIVFEQRILLNQIGRHQKVAKTHQLFGFNNAIHNNLQKNRIFSQIINRNHNLNNLKIVLDNKYKRIQITKQMN